jgi:hypothetical protein
MEEFRGLTAEMYQAIVAIVDDRLEVRDRLRERGIPLLSSYGHFA